MNDDVLAVALAAMCAVTAIGCPGNEPMLDSLIASGGGGSGASTGPGGAAGGGAGGAAVCGDGVQAATEQCDDNNLEPNDGCRADCTIEACGDTIVDQGMLCFAEPVGYTAAGSREPSLADLNGDGVLDVVLAGDSLSRRLATSPGVFGTSVELSPNAAGVGIGHADASVGDTALDLLASNLNSGGVYLNDGRGSFTFTSKGTLMTAPRVAVGDMNEDGDDDLLVTGCDHASGCSGGTSYLHVYLSQGDGTLANPILTSGHSSARTVVAAVDGNAPLDVLALNFNDGGSIGFYAGNGDGTVAAQVRSTVPSNCMLKQLVVGDVDGDGVLDAAVASSCSSLPIYVMRGVGNGTFTDAISLGTGGVDIRGLQLADLDNDGDLDVVAGTTESTLLFFAGDGAGGFAGATVAITLASGEVYLAVTDLDADGANDIVAARSNGGMSVILANP